MKYTLKSFILILAIIVSLGVVGQDNFKKGFVITLENDTLYGKINDAGGYKNARLCTFKPLKRHKVTEYLPGQIKGYQMFKDKYYASKFVEDKNGAKYKFVEVLIEGPVSLYHDRKSTDKAFYIQKKGSDLITLANKEMMLRYKPEGSVAIAYSTTYLLHNRMYRDTLRYLFSDSKAISNRVETLEYNPRVLSKITKDYIAEKYPSSEPVTYERDLRMYRPRVGIYGGIQLTDIEFLPSKLGTYSTEEPHSIVAKTINTYPVGIFFNFPLPMLNDKLSFQLEVMANSINYSEEFDRTQSLNDTTYKVSTQTIGLPLMIKYDLFKGSISPSLAVGKDFSFVYESKVTIDKDKAMIVHPVQKGGWFGEVGLNFKLSPGLSFFTNARYYTFKNLIIQKGNERASYNTVRDRKDFVKEFETSYATLLVGLKF